MKKLSLLFLILVPISVLGQMNYFMYATSEGIEMRFDIVDEEAKTCKVADKIYTLNYWSAIPISTEGEVTIPSKIKLGENTWTVVGIGNCAFQDCDKITKVNIPATVTDMGNPFIGCYSLNEIVVEDGNPVFDSRDNCNAIIRTTPDGVVRFEVGCAGSFIPNGVTELGSNAFSSGCAPDTIIIPKSILYIYDGFLSGCSEVKSIQVEEGNSIYDSRDNCNAIIESDNDWLMIGCMNSTVPNTVKRIYSYAFQGITTLKKLDIPNSVTLIGQNAFAYCEGLESINLPDSLAYISDNCFYRCSSLTSINIPASVKNIGNEAFTACAKLDTIHIDDMTSWLSLPFLIRKRGYNEKSLPSYYAHHLFLKGKEVVTVNVSDEVTQIPDYAFHNISTLKAIIIPDNVKEIGKKAFYGCSSLSLISVSSSEAPIIASDSYDWNTKDKNNNPLLCVPKGSFNKYSSSWGNFRKKEGCAFLAETSEKVVLAYTIIDDDNKVAHVGLEDNLTMAVIDGQSERLSLKNLVNGYSITGITDYAFQNCSIEEIVIPNGIEYIGRYAFRGCKKIGKILIPNSVTSIGSLAFADCIGLYSVTSLINVPFKLDASAFRYTNTNYDPNTIYYAATLYVPRGRKSFYEKIDSWNLFLNIEEKEMTYTLTYIVDDEVYKTYDIQAGEVITPEPEPLKIGYEFSGWIGLPEIMPDRDVTVSGSFTQTDRIIPCYGQKKIEQYWYSIDGHQLSVPPSNGLYIIRYSDGSTKKIFKK